MESLSSYTVDHPFSYSQFSQLSVELKSPLSKFCALSLNLTIFLLELCILLLKLGIFHLHLYLQPIYMENLPNMQCKYIVAPIISLYGYLYIKSAHYSPPVDAFDAVVV